MNEKERHAARLALVTALVGTGAIFEYRDVDKHLDYLDIEYKKDKALNMSDEERKQLEQGSLK